MELQFQKTRFFKLSREYQPTLHSTASYGVYGGYSTELQPFSTIDWPLSGLTLVSPDQTA
jgi:hypothetical protein